MYITIYVCTLFLKNKLAKNPYFMSNMNALLKKTLRGKVVNYNNRWKRKVQCVFSVSISSTAFDYLYLQIFFA
jgi:hypothetical protein